MKETIEKIAILRWEETQIPRGLVQLESLIGNSTNPKTYTYPVRFHRIRGANIKTVLENPSKDVLSAMIQDSKSLIADGIRAITTSCGFNAIFQKELTNALGVQVFTSSLLLVPLVRNMLSRDKSIGIITANKAALTYEHMEAVGISKDINIRLFGMEKCKEWSKIFTAPDQSIDLETVATEVVTTATSAVKQYPEIGAFILECTDLPPFAVSIRKAVRLPVYDFTTMVELIARSEGII